MARAKLPPNLPLEMRLDAEAAQEAGRRAIDEHLAAGRSVYSMDEQGRLLERTPDGEVFQVELRNSRPVRVAQVARPIQREHAAGVSLSI